MTLLIKMKVGSGFGIIDIELAKHTVVVRPCDKQVPRCAHERDEYHGE